MAYLSASNFITSWGKFWTL